LSSALSDLDLAFAKTASAIQKAIEYQTEKYPSCREAAPN